MWQTSNHSIAKIAIEQPHDKHSRVTAVAVSMCGNFGLLGYESGVVQKINMQSGKDRGVFVAKNGEGIHAGEVSGVGLDQLNKQAVSASLDGSIKLWDFFRGELIKTY